MRAVRTVARLLGGATLATSLFACGHAEAPAPLRVESPADHAEASAGDPGLGYVHATSATTAAPGKPDQVGLATWYGASFAGKKTTNGERFDPEGMTAAHRTLPFGTWVEVRRVETGAVVRVRINDRGPHGDRRKIIDLSHRAAKLLGIVEMGSAKVEVRVVSGPE